MIDLVSSPDVVVIGAGVAGSAMALCLARAGYDVVILEKSGEHTDRVRGEFIVPWGVAEARELGILGLLEQAGGNYTVRSIPYGEDLAPDQARAAALPMDQMVPGIRGALNLGHPKICDTLNEAAVDAGARILRRVDRLQVTAGLPPTVEFDHGGAVHRLKPRLIIGADGRGSAVARQIGFERQSDPIHHLFTGLLVDNAHEWPANEQSMGVDGDIGFYILPQGNGRIRLYIAHGLDKRDRFAGPGASERFLQAFDRPSLPWGPHLARARAAGPCKGYANNELWIDVPVAPGVVLIGDAAGYSDPSGGQGIGTAFRDARLVFDVLNGTTQWTPAAFESYVTERHEHTRRIRFSTRLLAAFRMEFTDDARRRRARGRARMRANPDLALAFAAFQKGPFGVPSEAFGEAIWQELIG